jgi:hypothetical protein
MHPGEPVELLLAFPVEVGNTVQLGAGLVVCAGVVVCLGTYAGLTLHFVWVAVHTGILVELLLAAGVEVGSPSYC